MPTVCAELSIRARKGLEFHCTLNATISYSSIVVHVDATLLLLGGIFDCARHGITHSKITGRYRGFLQAICL